MQRKVQKMPRKPSKLNTHPEPSINLKSISKYYLVFNGQIHSVVEVDAAIFIAFIKSLHYFADEGIKTILLQTELDIYDRWYLIEELGEKRRDIYASREIAMQALSAETVAVPVQ
jgi:hypothetical protein